MTPSREPLPTPLPAPAAPDPAPLARAIPLPSWLSNHRRGATLALCAVLIPAITLADIVTGYEFALSPLYMVPIFAVAWVFGERAGLALSVVATLGWLATDILTGHEYSHPGYRYLEFLIKLGTFALFALMLGALKRALERSDDRLIKVLEGLDAAVCVLDPSTDAILYRNRRFESAFAEPWHAERARDAHRLLGLARAAAEGGVIDVDGRWYLVRARELTWTDNRRVLLATATDITERRLAEESSREQQERLEATARLVAAGEIASSIAHELNQPLAAIVSYLSGALRRLRAGRATPEAIAGAMEEAAREAERAGDIIRRVRDFVRARDATLVAADLNGIVSKAARLVARDAERFGARLEVRLTPTLPEARGDPVLLEQVVINLLRNALEAMIDTPSDRRVVEIATARAGDGTLEVAVADGGPGVAPEAAARLFEPFFTTKAEGTGLGLNICRSIVEGHGGRIAMAPSPLGGALFRFTVRSASEEA